jgi:hypothetical protein
MSVVNNQQKQESLQRLTTLFTHRHNWISKEKGCNWKTLKKELSDNQLINLYQDPLKIIGVGFGKETSYLVLDIDKDSPYHYHQDADAINTIKDILWQEFGLQESIVIQSSYSRGIHLYYPLLQSVKSYHLGKAVTEMLEIHGYQVKGGKLEVFPNKKKGGYTKDKKQWTSYNRLRLPLQPESGSWILDDDFNPLVGADSDEALKAESLDHFWWLWDKAAACQDMNQLTIAMDNKPMDNKPMDNKPMDNKPMENKPMENKPMENKPMENNFNNTTQEKFTVTQQGCLSKGQYQYQSWGMKQIHRELQEQIDLGFTGDAQTNDLLLNLGRRVRIVERIGDTALRDKLLEIVKAMSGYHQYCGHLQDMWQRCQDVARWATKKFYVIGEKKSQPLPELKTTNEQKKRDAEVRILEGLVDAFTRSYNSVREFVGYVTKLIKCSPKTLYKYKQLWQERLDGLLVKTNVVYSLTTSLKSLENQGQDCPDNFANSAREMVCNSPASKGLKAFSEEENKKEEMVCNSPASKGLRAFSEGESQKEEMVCNSPASKGLRAFSPSKEEGGGKRLKPRVAVDLSWFLVAPPLLRLYILSSRFRLFLQGSFSCLLSNLFLKDDKKNKQSNNSLNQSSSNTPTNYVLHPQQNFTTKKTTETTDSEEESVTANSSTKKGTDTRKSEVEEQVTAPTTTQTPTSTMKSGDEFIVEPKVVDSVKEQPAPLAVNFEDWYKGAIDRGIVEDVPINWLPKMMGQYMVRLPQPDPLTGAPYTLVKWRELALTSKPT